MVALTGGASAQPAANDPSERRITSRGAVSRDRILDASLYLLWEGGYPALSISAVCKRAKVSPASLYHHFGDKAGLMTAMIDESLLIAARRFYDLVGHETRPLAQIDGFVGALRSLGKDYRANTIGVLATLSQGAGEAPEIAEAIASTRRRAWTFVATEMADAFGLEDGAIFAHLQFAYATYIGQVARDGGSKEERGALYQSFRCSMIITLAAMRPALLDDAEFAAAVAECGRSTASTPPWEASNG